MNGALKKPVGESISSLTVRGRSHAAFACRQSTGAPSRHPRTWASSVPAPSPDRGARQAGCVPGIGIAAMKQPIDASPWEPAARHDDGPDFLLGFPPFAWAMAVLFIGLGFTVWLVSREWNDMQARAQSYQREVADDASRQLRVPLDAAAAELRAMQTVFLANDHMDQERFSQVTANLQRQRPWSARLATAFASREQGADGRTHYRYQYVTPLRGNEVLLGLDIASQQENLIALEHARDSNWTTLSAPFPLRQALPDGEVNPLGITIRLPVYSNGKQPTSRAQRRAREIGALAVSLRLAPMINEALRGEVLDTFRVSVRDTHAPATQPFFDSGADTQADASTYTQYLDFGQRRWEIRMVPRPAAYDSERLQVVLTTGSAISVLIALLLWSLTTTRSRAIALGNEMSARFRESEARFRTLNELLPALVLVSDGDGRILHANQAARMRLGDVVTAGVPLTALFSDPQLRERVRQPVQSGEYWDSVEAQMLGLGGAEFWAATSIARVEVGGEPRLLMVATDISEQRELTERLSYQATHDALTELYNRREFERRVEQALADRRDGGRACALLYIDLDQFKLINDISGHTAGDQLLAQLALAMRLQLRGDDMLARLGGDEFGLLAFDLDMAGTRALAERLRAGIESQMFVWQERTYTVSASIGVVVVEQGDPTLKDVLAWADTACYVAKENGRNRVHVYREDDETTRRYGEMEWANRLRWALDEQRLLLDYQEIVPLDGRRGEGARVELLLRLRDEDGRVVLPGAFLPAAERYGLMPMVDRWVIRTALAHLGELHAQGRDLQQCAINLSGASIEDDDLADYILGLIEEHGIKPSCLCFEITETVAVRSLLKVVGVVERLRSAGCRIALDDFGAGMSSFGYLKNLPVDVIKIDGSFIRDLETDPMSRTIVSAIVQIGHQRGLSVVAEWVGSASVALALSELGVDYGQGMALHTPERVSFQRVREAA